MCVLCVRFYKLCVPSTGEDDYMAFGMSGSPTEPKMVGGDVVIVHMDGYLGSLRDYNLSSYMPVC